MSRPTVLVVDTDPMLRDFLSDRLALEGWDVTLAEPGDAYDRKSYDIVLDSLPRPFCIERVLERLDRKGPPAGRVA